MEYAVSRNTAANSQIRSAAECCPAGKSEGDVTLALRRLDQEAKELEEVLGLHLATVLPVLKPDSPATNGCDKSPSNGQCGYSPLSERINSACESLMRSRLNVMHITQRVQL